ncbi:hypothetical protein CAT67_11290 [Acinetobacter baumannii]|uniref:hypothetical protein n=1 Tax=Acinetobacter baumannii TaxID=470 RepID=UPI000A39CD54|nr:hypothetical protein [Acinetobacter baumannii]OTU00109.1 hypothetical protein CAT67_11290 [Acinetobacter baumannii]
MISNSKTAIDTIGKESHYLLEKTRAAIYGVENAYLQIALNLLKDYRENLTLLKQRIDGSALYDNFYFDYEFETIFFAIDKLNSLLGRIHSKDQELEAAIFHSHIAAQDNSIRRGIEEAEQSS